jgi:endonuclease III
MTVEAEITDQHQVGPFKYRWPDGYEDFEGGWDFQVAVGGARHRGRHGIGARRVYGRWRVHTVTWLDREVQVEGVEADDYPASRALISQLKHADKTVVRSLADVPQAVLAAFTMPPSLHRFVNQVAGWVVDAAGVVAGRYEGDASGIWNDRPSAAELRSRFDAFAGIGQKKAAMAVEILERDLHVSLSDLTGSDIAYDVHVRRVFLRTGLAQRDDVAEMIAIARTLHPERPGELDNPAWDIGRRWCHPRNPDCRGCPLVNVCPRLIGRGDAVKGA